MKNYIGMDKVKTQAEELYNNIHKLCNSGTSSLSYRHMKEIYEIVDNIRKYLKNVIDNIDDKKEITVEVKRIDKDKFDVYIGGYSKEIFIDMSIDLTRFMLDTISKIIHKNIENDGDIIGNTVQITYRGYTIMSIDLNNINMSTSKDILDYVSDTIEKIINRIKEIDKKIMDDHAECRIKIDNSL